MTEAMSRIAPNAPETASQDGLTLNVERLRALFPEAFIEGRLDFEVLKELLGAQIETRPEKYGLNWHGKAAARRHALMPTRATLRPDPASSVDWDTTQNLMIEGDNLEVLKLLQRSYAGKVKLIYIDPPYNTGKDFVYPDDYTDSIANYQSLTGQSEEGRRVSSNTESSGRFHSDWLNMMYPRLKLTRELLRDDGIVFVSIDANEHANLAKICDDVFGEENNVSHLVWHLSSGPQAGHFTRSNEIILVYARNKSNLSYFGDTSGGTIKHGALKKISRANPPSVVSFKAGSIQFEGDNAEFSGLIGGSETQDIKGKMVFKKGILEYDVDIEAGWAMKNQLINWLNGEETFDSKGQKVLRFYFNSQGILFYEKERGTIHPKTVLPSEDYGGTSAGSAENEELMGANVFSYPKPIKLIQFFIEISSYPQDIILDFFAGSGTTGHAVMAQNAADSGNRQYILVQLPEPLDPAKAEQKTAADFCTSLGLPLNIAELTKERLRRAGAKVKAENPMFAGDTGFKVFKLDSSNLTEWDAAAAQANLEQTLEASVNNIKQGRTEQDVLFELLLKLGLELTTPIETREMAGKQVHSVGAGALMVCLERGIDGSNFRELGQGIADWTEAQDAAGGSQVVFLDNGFDGDMTKTNATKLLEQRAKALGRTWTVRSI